MDQAQALLQHFSGPEAYAIFYFLLLGCGIGLPLNSDLIMLAAAIMAAMGSFELRLLILLAVLGLLSGDAINYFVARKFGKKLLRLKPFSLIIPAEKVERAEIYLQRRGTGFLFLVRFLPLVRTVLYFTAGSLQVSPWAFFTLDGLSTLIYVPLLMNLGFYLGGNSEHVVQLLKRAQFSFLGFLLVAGVTFLLLRNLGKKRDPAVASFPPNPSP